MLDRQGKVGNPIPGRDSCLYRGKGMWKTVACSRGLSLLCLARPGVELL